MGKDNIYLDNGHTLTSWWFIHDFWEGPIPKIILGDTQHPDIFSEQTEYDIAVLVPCSQTMYY